MEVRDLILAARQTVARGVNAALVLLYWKVGDRIRREILKEKRAEEKLTPDLVFRDPCFLDFLGRRGAYSEKDLETAIHRKSISLKGAPDF
ncbi:hypothetical protein NXS98_12260 [Fontisphaera persica]|uniref:DUF1016 N-terminal domain-containing protein n=1 Tax=Fontisphaera persica TaxID=2974023 RepID=UPI0024BFFD5E|nr:hypothetical protein [Fontisphaera persica]WCJ58493.1 hypothetical protein NXS98_12260 [Fontisphaera persica]